VPSPLEHVRARLGVHSAPGVDHREHDVTPRLERGDTAPVLARELGVRGADRDRPVPGDRVARVDDEVDDQLLELRRIRDDRLQLGLNDRVERDVLADQPTEHLLREDDDVVQVERARVEDLPAAEGQELAGQRCRTVGDVLDSLELAP
jgi:hypothetical protein